MSDPRSSDPGRGADEDGAELPNAMDDVVQELKRRVERHEYEIDPHLVAEALLRRLDLLGTGVRLSPRRARDRSGRRPDGPPRRAG
jgi:hypothetical protein